MIYLDNNATTKVDKKVLANYVALRRETVKNGTINRELAIISAAKNLADNFWEVKTNPANPLKFKLPEPAENIKYLKDLGISNCVEAFVRFYNMFLLEPSTFDEIFSKYDHEDLVVKLEKNIAIMEYL